MSITSEASDNNTDHEDDERMAIKNELSSLSFEALQKLKERIGAKQYKEVIFGSSVKACAVKKIFKRENKNRPREMSSKKPVPILRDTVALKKTEIRDPRFDPLCGTFDKKEFSANYNFVSNIRINDIKAIKAKLKETKDPEKEIKLRRLLQRLKDQQRSSNHNKLAPGKTNDHKLEKDISQTLQPHFKNKAELRVESLVQQYEDLKKSGTGRIQRHLKRRQQKMKKRMHRPSETTNV